MSQARLAITCILLLMVGSAQTQEIRRSRAAPNNPAAAHTVAREAAGARVEATLPDLTLQVMYGGAWVDSLTINNPQVLDLRWSAKGAMPSKVRWRLVEQNWLVHLGQPMPAALAEGVVDGSEPVFSVGLSKYIPKYPPAQPYAYDYWIHVWPEDANSSQMADTIGTTRVTYKAIPIECKPETTQGASTGSVSPEEWNKINYYCDGNMLRAKNNAPPASCGNYLCKKKPDGTSGCLQTCKDINDCHDPERNACMSQNGRLQCLPRTVPPSN